MSFLRRAMLYLGLGADEDYDEYARADERVPPPRHGAPRGVPGRPPSEGTSSSGVRTITPEGTSVRPVPGPEDAGPRVSAVQGTGGGGGPSGPADAGTGSVRTVSMPSRAKPTVLSPRSYNDAKQIGDTFKSRQPVIINLQDLRTDVAHRLVDFAAGLTFALDGQMEKVTQNVFLLTPANMEVDDDERRRLTERGLGD